MPYLSESSLQHYPGRVEVAVKPLVATSAVKGAYDKRDLVQCPTEKTLLRRIRGENLDNELTRSLGFVLREASKLTPTCVRDGLCECVVPDHVPDFQVLEGDQVVSPNQPGTHLVVEVCALSRDLGRPDGQQPARPVPVVRAFPGPGEVPLEALQPPLGFPEELRVWDLHPVCSRYQ